MKTLHKGMKISESDWSVFLQHAGATMEALKIPKQECDEVVAFVLSLKEGHCRNMTPCHPSTGSG